MTSKTKLLYKRAINIFFKVRNHILGNEITFKYCHYDMEETLLKAINEIITNTKIKLCYYHFSQSIMKRIHNTIYEDLFQFLFSIFSLLFRYVMKIERKLRNLLFCK